MKKLIIVTGPSGIGKTHLAQTLMQNHPDKIHQVQIYTTRKPRSSEQKSSDRLFIDRSTFQQMKSDDAFWFEGEFHNNLYGFTRDSLQPQSTHLIVNIWPYAVPKFLQLENSVLIGLAIKQDNIDLLKHRMRARGDSVAGVQERLLLIQRDSKDLEIQKKNFRKHDRLFYVHDDRTIPEEIIPWIESELGLQP